MKTVTADDKELVAAVRAGDREAYGGLVQRHQRAIFSRCYQMTGNVPDAEELAHQAFVEGFVKLDQLREPSKFLPWLRMLALNLCRMGCRERQRRIFEPLDEDLVAESAGDSIEKVSESLPKLAPALTALTPAHRIILVLRYFEDLSYEDIATFLDVPVGTIMSRLHRAHRALKNAMENTYNDEVEMVMAEEDFRKEVEAEIAVLLELCGQDSSAMDRLAVILRQSPERLSELLKTTENMTVLDNLACLLPHLGTMGYQIVLNGCLSEDGKQAQSATAVLKRFVTRLKSQFYGPYASGGMPARNAYRLLEAMIVMLDSAERKAALLAALLEASEDEGVSVLITNILLCYPDAAFSVLSERFWNATGNGKMYENSNVLHALCRTGTRFCQSLLDPLQDTDRRLLAMALEGVQAIARCLDPPWLADASPWQYANDRRTRRKWAPLRRAELGDAVFNAMLERTAAVLAHDAPEIRETALAALGKLRVQHLRGRIEELVAHPVPSTRRAAILALGDIGDPACADTLTQAAQTADPLERLAAVRALARLRIEGALLVFLEALDDTDPEVRRAAVLGIGDIGGEEATGMLKELVRSKDAQARKAAAKILAGRANPQWKPSPLGQERRDRAGTVHGQAFTYRSLDAAIRFAMPALRPYEHRDLTQRLALVCDDFAAARRQLIDDGLMERIDDVYELTDLGKTVWRVEHFIMEKYLA